MFYYYYYCSYCDYLRALFWSEIITFLSLLGALPLVPWHVDELLAPWGCWCYCYWAEEDGGGDGDKRITPFEEQSSR